MSDDKEHNFFHVRGTSIRWDDDANGLCLQQEMLLLIFLRDAKVYLVEFTTTTKTFQKQNQNILGNLLENNIFLLSTESKQVF